MTRALALVAVLAVALASCAATLSVRGTAPDSVSEGSCQYARTYPARDSVWVYASAAGRTDSLRLAPGQAFGFAWITPSGIYTVTAWARNTWGASCSSSVVVTAGSRPSPVRITP